MNRGGSGFVSETSTEGVSRGDRLLPVRALIDAARQGSDAFASLLAERLPVLSDVELAAMRAFHGHPSPRGVGDCAVAVWEETCLIAVLSERAPVLSLDGADPSPMTRVAGTSYWFSIQAIETGALHRLRYGSDGEWAPGVDFAGYGPRSYELPNAKHGTLLERRTIASEVYPGATTNYWIYVNAGIDEKRGAPLMVWHDGEGCLEPADPFGFRMQIVTDNLVHTGAIPPMVHLLVNPSTGGEGKPFVFGERYGATMRGIQYDTFSDRYGRHIVEEVIADAGRVLKLRPDAYSRGTAGGSSGAVCAFALAWFRPDQFSRAQSVVGSFVDINGGHVVPHLVRREQKRNIRIWMSVGMNDLDLDGAIEGGREVFEAGSWPLQNILLANALKGRNYDFHFRYGDGFHGGGQAALDLPESLTWLWRDYDPDRAEQLFEQDLVERAKPVYRVRVANREAW
jgi:enterochelin esterase-like enzyme